MIYAEVILPLHWANTFTYRIPDEMAQTVKPLCRVLVPFGRTSYYTGIVAEIHNRSPQSKFKIKDLYALLDSEPMMRAQQFSLWQWTAAYYICTLGDVYRTAVPVGLKTKLAISDTGIKAMKRGYKMKKEIYIRLADSICSEADVHAALNVVNYSLLQTKLLTDYLSISQSGTIAVTRKTLMDYSGAKPAILHTLIRRNILAYEEKIVSRIWRDNEDVATEETILSAAQQTAYEEILRSFENKDVTLLHGVTSSGKTEIYIKLISDALSQGRQALFLMPEISVTTQMTERLKRVFGKRLLAYHSGYTDNERVEVWNHLMQSDEPVVVLGIRSSIFLPFSRLGLIVVDEEQDTSYKQQDTSPRYHARNAAMMLALRYGAKTLLGSATPSLESYLWASTGKYGFVALDSRYGEGSRPEITIVNVGELRRKKQMEAAALLSPALREKIELALSNGEQALLFQNSRGFAYLHVCNKCNEASRCAHCDVSLVYHKRLHRLVCHYCGYSVPLPSQCPACGSEDMKLHGFGTEKVEEEVAAMFPSARIARLDTDTARTKKAFERILSDFKAGHTQILIGARMVLKGFDFENISVVGIIDADGMMKMPDFRAYEHAFQLFLQVSGRAGRRSKPGAVVIQTSQSQLYSKSGSQLPLLQTVQQFDYKKMAETQLPERHALRYPPYTRLIMIVLRYSDEDALDAVAKQYSEKLKIRFGYRVSDPIYPPVARVQAQFVRKIMLKMELTDSVPDTRKILEDVRADMQKNSLFKRITIHYDVDPY